MNYWISNFDNIFTFQNGFFSASEKYKTRNKNYKQMVFKGRNLNLTLYCIMLKSGQTYFKNLAV